ncbi:MAG: hypothetical protein PHQ19_10550 [Candidatus Krumholzibacteria bacterium]|nr:hypothetical protein [Candidatus Krumholzibacteria bacterium]
MTKGMICLILGVLTLGMFASDPALARRDDDQTMLVSPRVLFLGFSGTRITIHTCIPYSSVDRESIRLSGDGDGSIAPVSTKSDSRGNLVVKFAAADVATIVSAPRSVLTMTGDYTEGGSFSLTGYIIVKEISLRRGQ